MYAFISKYLFFSSKLRVLPKKINFALILKNLLLTETNYFVNLYSNMTVRISELFFSDLKCCANSLLGLNERINYKGKFKVVAT